MNQIDLGGVVIDSYPVRYSEFSERDSIENEDQQESDGAAAHKKA